MKKIMFNDKFGLTKAVLDGRKTQTRRIVLDRIAIIMQGRKNFLISSNRTKDEIAKDLAELGSIYSSYKAGEIVAIAQSYKDCGYNYCNIKNIAGWDNKMFVSANLMLHHIKIEHVRIERLQDISDEDCLAEGVCFHKDPPSAHYYDPYTPWSLDTRPYKHSIDNEKYFYSARYAYAHLIDKVSGKGTWEKNPFVFVYEFKLID